MFTESEFTIKSGKVNHFLGDTGAAARRRPPPETGRTREKALNARAYIVYI